MNFIFNHKIKALFLFIISLVLSSSLLFYNPFDPSFNLSGSNDVSNIMGIFGSYSADLMLQYFGVSSFILSLILLNWSFILLKEGKIYFFYPRLLFLFLSLIFISLSLNRYYSQADDWFFETYGGVIGILFDKLVPKNYLLNYLIIFLSLTSLLFCLGYSYNQYKNIFYALIFLLKNIAKISILPFKLFKNRENQKISNDKKIKKLTPKLAKDIKLEKSYHKAEGIKLPIENGKFLLPSTDLFSQNKSRSIKMETPEQLKENAHELIKVLNDFGIKGDIIDINQGPVVTLYEFEPSAGTKSSRVIGLADDIARSLSALSTRISVIPGRNVLGIELPNKEREFFFIKELIENSAYQDKSIKLPLILGKDLSGKAYVADLAKMPHLLVAGTTGSGKSVAINAMIVSLLYRYTPDECRFIMIDPKMLELSVYDGIPHLLTPVVTDPSKAIIALKWAVKEMENRYKLMSYLGVRNIDGYNERIKDSIIKNETLERKVQTGFNPETGDPVYEVIPIEKKNLSYIVVIVDEMADLMLVAGKDIEASIQRLAQMARAAGIHLIMATQRPSVDVITGVIKANFPSRISFKVTSKIDSRTIIAEQGAEQLLGMGDMLYMGGTSKLMRVHGPFIDDREVENIAKFLKLQSGPNYVTEVTESSDSSVSDLDAGSGDVNDLYNMAVQIVKKERKASTSFIQRCLKIGYNRAADLIDRMEKEGIISPANHVGKREVLIND